jgi:ferric-dicitrate binding protein FerR (iron transport regulator)
MKPDDSAVPRLISRHRLGTLTDAEREDLAAWISDDPDNARIFESVANASVCDKHAELSSIDRQKAWRELNAALGKRRPERTLRRTLRRWIVAASAVAAVAAGVIMGLTGEWFAADPVIDMERVESGRGKAILTLADNSDLVIDGARQEVITQGSARVELGDGEVSYSNVAETAPDAINAITVPRGGKYKVTLSDGTRVWLNSDSRIKYPMNFGAGERRVTLRGEACFDVVPDAARPFVVETAAQSLEVLGTEFCVCAYPDQPRTLTTLVEGSVRVAAKGSGRSVVLEAGRQAQLDNAGQTIVVADVDVRNFTAWRHGMINIQNNTLEQVLDKLSRWYDVDFVMTGAGLENMVFEGDIPMDSNLATVVGMLEEAGTIDFVARAGFIEVGKK